MILVDNIIFMKDRFPAVWEAYRAREDEQNPQLVSIEPSKIEDYPTLAVNKDEKTYYIHSRYNPEREARTIMDNFDGNEYEHVIFYGLGLGYHIGAFLERYPHLTFSLYEPIPEIFKAYLSIKELKNLPQNRLQEIVVETSPLEASKFLQRSIKKHKEILFIDLPSYKSAFAKEYNHFTKLFKENARRELSSIATTLTFEKRWVINSVLNFKEVMETPNIIVERKDFFKNKPAILVAAGPSLDYEIENLRQIKENGMAYIFSVGSAVNSLIDAGIYPDAQCAIDPGEANQSKVFARITEEGIVDIPLIFGSSIGYEVLVNYPGQDKLHMITNRDTISSYLLKTAEGKTVEGVTDAPSVAVVTLQLLDKLGFNPIILVGQNLAYKDYRHYAGGIAYADGMQIDSEKTQGLIKTKDVEGNLVYASISFEQMRLAIESYLKSMLNKQVINTTRGGAHIEGTIYKTLDEVMKFDIVREGFVDSAWYDIANTDYDKEYLKKRFAKLYSDYEELPSHFYQVSKILDEIRIFKEDNNQEQIKLMWPKLDSAYNRVKRNTFYENVTVPMNRVAYNLYFEKLAMVKFESNQVVKADVVLSGLGKAIYDSLQDLKPIFPLMFYLKNYVEGL